VVRTSLDDGGPREPQIAQLIDLLGVPVLTTNGARAEVKLYVKQGRTPHLTLHHGNSRYRRLCQNGLGDGLTKNCP